MNVQQMRQWLIEQYRPNPRSQSTWAAKVNKMPDAQVCAIYFRLSRNGQKKAS